VSFGSKNPMEALVLMMVDDGDSGERKMRENLMDPSHRAAGFAVGGHKK